MPSSALPQGPSWSCQPPGHWPFCRGPLDGGSLENWAKGKQFWAPTDQLTRFPTQHGQAGPVQGSRSPTEEAGQVSRLLLPDGTGFPGAEPPARAAQAGPHSPLLFEKVSLNPATLRKDPQPGRTQHQTRPCSAVPAPPRAQVGNSPHRGRRLWVSNSCFVFCGGFLVSTEAVIPSRFLVIREAREAREMVGRAGGRGQGSRQEEHPGVTKISKLPFLARDPLRSSHPHLFLRPDTSRDGRC